MFYVRSWRVAILFVLFPFSAVSPERRKILKKAVRAINPATYVLRVKDRVVENFHVVQPGKLYRSAQLSPRALEKYIKQHGIKTVVNLRGAHPGLSWWDQQKAVCDRHGVRMFDIPMSAQTLTSKNHLLKLLEIYDSAPCPMLIHCRRGADRTGEAAAIWCIEKMGHSNKKAGRQLSRYYQHVQYPAKDFLIKIWGGREWLKRHYHPGAYHRFKQPVAA